MQQRVQSGAERESKKGKVRFVCEAGLLVVRKVGAGVCTVCHEVIGQDCPL